MINATLELAAFDDWQAARGLRADTIRVRHDLLARLIIYLGKPLAEATEAELVRWEQRFAAPRAPETHRTYVTHVRAWCRWAIQVGVLVGDPSTGLACSFRPSTLLYEDELLFAVRAARPKTGALLSLAAWADLTCSQIAALDWSDLHKDRDGVALALLDVQPHRRPARAVPLAPVALRALRTYGLKDSGPMFLGTTGQRMYAKSVSGVGNRYLRLCGISATMTDLRHHRPVPPYRHN